MRWVAWASCRRHSPTVRRTSESTASLGAYHPAADEGVYRSRGAKMSSMTSQCHQQQRSNFETAGVYEKASKAAYKSRSATAWAGSRR